jgi:hypothetical protein
MGFTPVHTTVVLFSLGGLIWYKTRYARRQRSKAFYQTDITKTRNALRINEEAMDQILHHKTASASLIEATHTACKAEEKNTLGRMKEVRVLTEFI